MKVKALLISMLTCACMPACYAVEPAKAAINSKVNQVTPTASSSEVDFTPLLANYYQEVNRQLNEHLKTRPRDPFSNEFVTRTEGEFKPRLTTTPSNGNTTGQSANGNQQVSAKPSSRNAVLAGLNSNRNSASTPILSFKGFLESEGRKAALLQITGMGTFVVREGDHLGLQAITQDDTVIEIKEITELNVIVETGSFSGQSQQFVVQ